MAQSAGCDLDNNVVERDIRNVAIGRKNSNVLPLGKTGLETFGNSLRR